MTESASKLVAIEPSWKLRGFADGGRGSEAPAKDEDRAAEDEDAGPILLAKDLTIDEPDVEDARKKEWASALALVQEACESIRFSEERVEELERELEQAAIQSRDDLKQMLARLHAAQEEIQAANARADAAEARALEAEGWLGRLNQAIVEGFSRLPKPGDQDG